MNDTIRVWLLVFALGLPFPVQAGMHLGFHYGHHDHFGHHSYYGYYYDCYPYWSYYCYYYPDWSYRYYGHYPYHDGLVYGLLSIPRAVTGALFGSPHRYSYKDSSRANYRSDEPPGEDNGKNSTAEKVALSREWDLLASRRYGEALQGFEAVAQANPGSGEPKIGYALASASLGDFSQGVWAMRHAYRLDREAVGSIKIDARIRPQIEHLLAGYRDTERVDRREAAFMRASLYFLLGDMGRAAPELEIALEEGDRSLSTLHLRGLIVQAAEALRDKSSGALVAKPLSQK